MSKNISRRHFIKTGTLSTLGIATGCSLKPRFDVIIKNGLVYDGTGSAPVKVDLGIKAGRIAAIDKLQTASADQIIDAGKRIVCPGFIDIHTHTDMELLVNPKAESKIRQGVTTEVGGNCGSSPFPLTDADLQEFRKNMQERYELNADWQNLDGFYSALEKRGASLNYATLTGHGDLRSYAVGKNDVEPSAEQLTQMKTLLRQSIEQGSYGLSTGLEYAPGSYAKTDELIELTKVVAEYNGLYATHMRSEDDYVEEAVEEALRIGRESSSRVQISHLKACNPKNWHKTERFLTRIAEAIASGQPVLADRYPYIAYGTGLSIFLPLWSRQGTTDDILARLKDPSKRDDIMMHTEARGKRIGGWEKVVISSCFTEANKAFEGLSIAEAAERENLKPFDFITDLLIQERNRVGIVGFAMDEGNLKRVLAASFVMVGSDGNAVAPYGKLGTGKPHPRFYGTFPRVLGKYCREEKIFDVATAIKKMTSMPADQMGLKQRGRIARDYFADIVIFQPENIIDNATFTDPHQYPEGIDEVMVNGVLTVHKREHTGKTAGKMLRYGSA